MSRTWVARKGKGVVYLHRVDDTELTSICVDCGTDTGPGFKSLKKDNCHRCTPCMLKTPEGIANAKRAAKEHELGCFCIICKAGRS